MNFHRSATANRPEIVRLGPKRPGRTVIAGAPEGWDARVLADLAQAAGPAGLIYVAEDARRLVRLRRALAFFAPDLDVLALPAWDTLPYDRRSPSAPVSARRVDTLIRLGRPAEGPRLVVTTAAAFLRRLPARGALEAASFRAAPGEDIEEALWRFLLRHGYAPTDALQAPGDVVREDDRVELWAPSGVGRLRLDILNGALKAVSRLRADGTEVEIDRLDLLPMSEVVLDEAARRQFLQRYVEQFGQPADDDPLYEAVNQGRRHVGMEHWLPLFYDATETLCDYLPEAAVCLDDGAENARDAWLAQITDAYHGRKALSEIEARTGLPVYRPLPPEQLFLDAEDWVSCLRSRAVALFLPTPPDDETMLDAGARPGPNFFDPDSSGRPGGEALVAHVAAQREVDRPVVFAVEREVQQRPLMRRLKIPGLKPADNRNDAGPLSVAVLPVEAGFVTPDLAVIARADIFGNREQTAARRRRREDVLPEVTPIRLGDLVVHTDHGVGLCEGLEAVDAAGAPHDCVRLIYHDGDRLFVPVENLDQLWRFGAPGASVQLDRMGGSAWENRFGRVREAIGEAARTLIASAAKREAARVEPIAPPRAAYRRFVRRFPYTETEDQQQAIDDVLSDLVSGRLMDRLVCGDVGFGKTEVAFRAAFAVAAAGHQVALVAPTTVLARQHADDMRERFAGFDMPVAELSGHLSAAQAREVRQQIRSGAARLIVGTHALLAASIRFPDLGLLILDEEHRLGVRQKERIKELTDSVHVLTLTATPIPRTLQLAMTGLRDTSLITTPPVERQPIRTRALAYDAATIAKALRHERERGGQSFYVCPRIRDLSLIRERLEALAPELTIVEAHGRMTPDALDAAMMRFAHGGGDILLATNIIESGLNILNANTLIVHRADLFGLAQLYQLRGRVGRGSTRAFAYLTVESGEALSDTARRRLESVATLDRPGSGFSVATQDLEIRGGGNLMGEEQSGQAEAVGADLYRDMLRRAIEAARENREPEEVWTPRITLGMPVLIPENYVSDPDIRLSLYRTIAALERPDQAEEFAADLAERYGPPPPEVQTLLGLGELKRLCRDAQVEQFDLGPKGALVGLRDRTDPGPFLDRHPEAKRREDGRLVIPLAEATEHRLDIARTLLRELAHEADLCK
jgi:transcription-repair coupling factor (superfamily II helicase)